MSENLETISTIVAATRKAQDEKIEREVIASFTSPSAEKMEAVMFLKPEATVLSEQGSRFENLCKLVFEKHQATNLTIDAVSILAGKYLKKHDIIARHYGAINKISREGTDALSEAARENLQKLFGEDLSQGAVVMGGHQFVAEYPNFSPQAVDTLIANLGSTKLGPGTYCTKVKVENRSILLLNGFHPQQLEQFTSARKSIVVCLVRGTGSWKEWRTNLIGATNPAKAVEGSLRRSFLDRQQEFGFKEINQGNNAIHFSAGPLEGMVEIIRYFSDYEGGKALTFKDTSFGQKLLQAGFTENEIAKLAENTPLKLGDKLVPAFDATEEMQDDEALPVLKEGKASL